MRPNTSRFEHTTGSTEWSESYQTHPAVFLGLAVGVGLVLGLMKARRSSRSSAPRAYAASAAPKPPLRERSPKVAQLVSTWEQISDALLGVATARAIDAIAEYVPGFKDQYERQSGARANFRQPEPFPSSR
jgi:hypothetical protein